jgi:hypothetical protein
MGKTWKCSARKPNRFRREGLFPIEYFSMKTAILIMIRPSRFVPSNRVASEFYFFSRLKILPMPFELGQ